MFTFTAVISKRASESEIEWFGFNYAGTLVYGLRSFNLDNAVQIFRATVFGSVHKIAEIEFAANCVMGATIFYAKRQQFAWTYLVDKCIDGSISPQLALVMFNVATGEHNRYYAMVKDITSVADVILIHAVNDRLILLAKSQNKLTLHAIILDPLADETMSVNFLADLVATYPISGVEFRDLRGCVVFCHDRLIFVSAASVDHAQCYEFESRRWYLENVTFHECEQIQPFHRLRRSFDGSGLLYLNLSSYWPGDCKMQLYELDVFELRLTEIVTDNCVNEELFYFNGALLASATGRTVCTFHPESHDEGNVVSVRIEARNYRKMQPLIYQCILALRRHIRDRRPSLSDHDVCEQLSTWVTSVVPWCEYFGRKFT